MRLLFCLAFCLSFFACSGPRQLALTPAAPGIGVNGKLWSSLFQQRAAEYQALCIQAFSIAKDRLDQALGQGHSKPMAIITDIDETLLDNSRYAVGRALAGKEYEPQSWTDWTARAEADTMPGAPSFLQYAASRMIEVFYVTNRKPAEKEGTLENLRKFGFPNADTTHLLLRTGPSSKEPRRQSIFRTHEVVLLLGDNLADFSDSFDLPLSPAGRVAAVKALAPQFGNRFIVLPNANYGQWEDAIYGYRYNLTPAQKDSAIIANLHGY